MKPTNWVASLAILVTVVATISSQGTQLNQNVAAQPMLVAQTTSIYTTTIGPPASSITPSITITVSTLKSSTTVTSAYATTLTYVYKAGCSTGQTCTAEYAATSTYTSTITGPIILVPIPEFELSGIALAFTIGLLLIILSSKAERREQ